MDEQNKPALVAVVGPTASGKTALAVRLALALDGEVVSADSMQIYRGMNIATAKPDSDEMCGVRHHLLDFVEPGNASFSVARYVELAHEAIRDISSRGKLPILAGGTGLYISSVVDGISYQPMPESSELRQRLRAQAEICGAQQMHSRLSEVDPELAARLHPSNLGRVIRALEVYELTGVTMSEHQKRSRECPEPYRACMLGINYSDRAVLYDRIDRRVDDMIKRGLVEEAQSFGKVYAGTAAQAIGHKELQPFFAGESTLDECVGRLKQATRNYAKRQLTWFRRDKRVNWLLADTYPDFEEMCIQAQNLIHNSGIL